MLEEKGMKTFFINSLTVWIDECNIIESLYSIIVTFKNFMNVQIWHGFCEITICNTLVFTNFEPSRHSKSFCHDVTGKTAIYTKYHLSLLLVWSLYSLSLRWTKNVVYMKTSALAISYVYASITNPMNI